MSFTFSPDTPARGNQSLPRIIAILPAPADVQLRDWFYDAKIGGHEACVNCDLLRSDGGDGWHEPRGHECSHEARRGDALEDCPAVRRQLTDWNHDRFVLALDAFAGRCE